jgi:hypothetical protein
LFMPASFARAMTRFMGCTDPSITHPIVLPSPQIFTGTGVVAANRRLRYRVLELHQSC